MGGFDLGELLKTAIQNCSFKGVCGRGGEGRIAENGYSKLHFQGCAGERGKSVDLGKRLFNRKFKWKGRRGGEECRSGGGAGHEKK